VASNSFIGAGVILVDRVRIGRNSVVAAGSVVFNDIPDGSIVMGNPAKLVGKND
jgi:maltose O-acetyltransferase